MEFSPEVLQSLLATFRVELEDELQIVTDSLLELEEPLEGKARQEVLNTIFRAVHTIKGAARCVDVNDVMEIAHHLESVFSTLKGANANPAPAQIDLCLEGVGRMREAVEAFEKGEALKFDLGDLLRRIETGALGDAGGPGGGGPRQEQESQESQENAVVAATEKEATAGVETQEEVKASAPPPTEPASERGETQVEEEVKEAAAPRKAALAAPSSKEGVEVIRVMVDRVERLGSLAEELQMAKLELDDQFFEIERMRGEIEEFVKLWNPCLPASKGKRGEALPGDLRRLFLRGAGTISECNQQIRRMQKGMRSTVSRLGILSGALGDDVRMLRLVSASTVLRPLALNVREIARDLRKKVNLEIQGDDVQLDRAVLQRLRDPLLHLLRNAIDHGLESPEERQASGKAEAGKLVVRLRSEGNEIEITVEDDGAGISTPRVGRVAVEKRLVPPSALESMTRHEILDLIFRPGFSCKETVTRVSGRGVGLDVVRANLRTLKGSSRVDSEEGRGTRFTLRVPLTLAAEHGLLVRAAEQVFAIPITAATRVMDISADDIVEVEASRAVRVGDRVVPLRDLAGALELPSTKAQLSESSPALVISKGWDSVALLVDEVIGEREIVVKPLRPPLVSLRNVTGGTLTGGGEIIMVLNPANLVDSALERGALSHAGVLSAGEAETAPPHILVVDDSITTRTLEKSILESKGYQVSVAVNGKEAWDLLQTREPDLVLSDVEMPVMDGFELTRRIKESVKLSDLPVVIVSSRANDSDKQRGVEVGADAYIVKGAFETTALLEVVEQLV